MFVFICFELLRFMAVFLKFSYTSYFELKQIWSEKQMKRRTKSVAIRMQIQHNVRYETFMATGRNDVSQEISHEMNKEPPPAEKGIKKVKATGTYCSPSGWFTHSTPCPCHDHAVPLPCCALIPTCHAVPLPCSDSAVSFMKVRMVAGNIRTASPTF